MKPLLRHTFPVVIVAVSLGAGGAVLLASTGSDAKGAGPPREAISDCKPAPARCGSEDNDLVIAAANEAARRQLEFETTGSTAVVLETVETIATVENGESREQAALASGSLVPEAWGALIDYESLAAGAR
jgi:hypothetical protein